MLDFIEQIKFDNRTEIEEITTNKELKDKGYIASIVAIFRDGEVIFLRSLNNKEIEKLLYLYKLVFLDNRLVRFGAIKNLYQPIFGFTNWQTYFKYKQLPDKYSLDDLRIHAKMRLYLESQLTKTSKRVSEKSKIYGDGKPGILSAISDTNLSVLGYHVLFKWTVTFILIKYNRLDIDPNSGNIILSDSAVAKTKDEGIPDNRMIFTTKEKGVEEVTLARKSLDTIFGFNRITTNPFNTNQSTITFVSKTGPKKGFDDLPFIVESFHRFNTALLRDYYNQKIGLFELILNKTYVRENLINLSNKQKVAYAAIIDMSNLDKKDKDIRVMRENRATKQPSELIKSTKQKSEIGINNLKSFLLFIFSFGDIFIDPDLIPSINN